MSKNVKIIIAALLVTVVIGVFGKMDAYAGYAQTPNGEIEGQVVYGTLSTSTDSATATTVFYMPECKRIAVARVYYEKYGGYYYTSASSTGYQSGGIAATATKQISSATVVGGEGIHSLAYGAYTWNNSTTIGHTPSDAKQK